MLIGYIWCMCAAVVFIGMVKGEKENKGTLLIFFIIFAFFGICGILGAFFRNWFLTCTARILSCSAICLGLFFKSLYNEKVCDTPVVGVFLGSQAFKSFRGYGGYAPIFKYYYQGNEYQAQAFEVYSRKKTNAYFTQGQSYTIYVNPKNPWRFVTRKGQLGNRILLVSVGIFLLCAYVVMLIK